MHPRNLPLILCALLVGCGIANSQESTPAQHKREAALDLLLSERGPLKDLEAAIVAARKNGVSDQAILEARFLYHVDMLEDSAIAAMLPEFLTQHEHFRLEDSAIFAVKEDWLSVVEYVKAIHALDKGDQEGFKKHIKEAFWLGPRQAAAFAPHIERLRHDEAMKAIAFDLKQRLASLDGSPPITLKSLIDGRKALLIHFWSPHSRESVISMEDFASTAQSLISHNIAVVSLCAQRSPAASEVIEPYNKGKHGQWLVDPDEDSIGRLLRIQSLPSMALISHEGRVLFSGDPTDLQFWRALQKLAPEMKRPDANADF
jgi:hypothetical protein